MKMKQLCKLAEVIRTNSFADIIVFTSAWIQPILFIPIALLLLSMRGNDFLSVNVPFIGYVIFFLISFVPSILVTYRNLIAYENGKKHFGLIDGFRIGEDPVYTKSLKESAKYPEINQEMLMEIPKGVVFGKDIRTGQYVCRNLKKQSGHVFLIGASRSGKTTGPIIDTILANDAMSICAIDIKGDINAACIGEKKKAAVFNPYDDDAWGYDPLFLLREEPDEQAVLENMREIANSLITIPADIKEPFWKMHARSMLTGLLVYCWESGIREFIDMIDKIYSVALSAVVEEAVINVEPDSNVYRLLINYLKLGSNTFESISSELISHIDIFATDRYVRKALKDAEHRITPELLEENYDVFYSVPENKIDSLRNLLILVVNQTLSYLETRPLNSKQMLLVVDELARICATGKLEKLQAGLQTLAGRGVTLFLCTQTVEGLLSAYSSSEVYDMMANCSEILVLTATSKETQDLVIRWSGKYQERKETFTGIGNKGIHISYCEKDIVNADELISLPETKEAILISQYYGYMRIRKAPYYSDPYFKQLQKEIKGDIAYEYFK